MNVKDVKILNRISLVLETLGSFGIIGCTVALIAVLASEGNACAALGVGIALGIAAVCTGLHFGKLAVAALTLFGAGNGDD